MDRESTTKLIKKALESNSETSMVEFKDGRGGLPRDIWKTVSSFSHQPGGGIIVFGVVEDQKEGGFIVVEIGNIASLQEKFGDVVNNQMSFVLRPTYHILEIQGCTVLAIFVPECPPQFKPCYYRPVGLPNGAYIRDGNTDRRMTDREMRKLIENSRKYKFDIKQAGGTKLEDLSKKKVLDLLIKSGKRTKREASLEDVNFELLQNLGIADKFEGVGIPTIAGFLIFSKGAPQDKKGFSRYIVRCVRYKGSNVATDIIDSIDVAGTLDTQIDNIQKFILRNIKKSSRIVGTKRVEKYEYPEKAIREIVANAIIHRDYKITETYIQVNLFEDRVEVFNPGCLPPGVTIENIKDAQVSRNEIIAARLKDLDYLEEYGRGIDIVFDKMKEWDLLPPIFKNTANSFRVILMGEKLSNLNERQIKIWNYLVENKRITAKDCGKILPETPRVTLNYDLNKMREMGILQKFGESINTYYEATF